MINLLPNEITKKLYDDKGFVTLVDMMPRFVPEGRTADIAIARNARVSYNLGDKTVQEDRMLIRYLLEHYHTSPFESVVFQFRIRLPIYVERQLIRHRTARVNEQSFRYIVPVDEMYFPPCRLQSKDNKQGSLDGLEGGVSDAISQDYDNIICDASGMYQKYQELISMGVAKEVARTILPVSMMTEIMWQMDLHNLLHFIRLRSDKHAQAEIRELSDAILEMIEPLVPSVVEAFRDFRLNSVTFSQNELSGKDLSKRQTIELEKKLTDLRANLSYSLQKRGIN